MEAVFDGIAMKVIGFILLLLAVVLIVFEGIPIPQWNPAPRQSFPLMSLYGGMMILGAGMVIGSRFVTFLAGILGAVGKYLPGPERR